MPFALVIVGLIAVMSAIKGTQQQLGAQLVKDFTGQNSFLVWMAAICTVGLIGYIPALQKFSRAFLVLVILAIILSHQGFFQQLYAALQAGPTAPQGGVSLSAQTSGTPAAPTPSSIATGLASQIPGVGGLLGAINSFSFF
jgi:hypothetical protein